MRHKLAKERSWTTINSDLPWKRTETNLSVFMHLKLNNPQGVYWCMCISGRAKPMSESYRKSICLSIRLAVATRGRRPVDSECSSRLEEMSCVVISVSAAVPAPQQLDAHKRQGGANINAMRTQNSPTACGPPWCAPPSPGMNVIFR